MKDEMIGALRLAEREEIMTYEQKKIMRKRIVSMGLRYNSEVLGTSSSSENDEEEEVKEYTN